MSTANKSQPNGKPLRAVGYCRTSGEGQRDNTSIPNQRSAIEKFCEVNDWKFVGHYVDESKSGSNIEGRDDFQRMLKDAALGKFDMIVVFDVSRFSRDTVDILGTAKFLKQTFGIHVVDTKGRFDTRSRDNKMMNAIYASVSEDERDRIAERLGQGKFDQAKDGRPWSGNRPFGRDCPKDTDRWSINDDGRRMRALLEEYAARKKGMTALAKKYGFSSANRVFNIIRTSQLAGAPYVAELFNPETGIVEKIPIPQIPAVITSDLAEDVQDRMEHRRRFKDNHRRYVLTGFVRCGHCNMALTGNAGKYYRHCANPKPKRCVFGSIPSDALVNPVLDYLYSFFTDEPTFNAAVSAALPSEDERAAIEAERDRTRRSLAKVDNKISNLAKGLAEGVNPAIVRGQQDKLLAEKEGNTDRLEEIEARLKAMPEREVVQREAMAIRLGLLQKVNDCNWRKLPFDDVHRFLVFLFGDNPVKTGNGIQVMREQDHWNISFRGNVQFHHDIVDGRALFQPARKFVASYNKWIKKALQERVVLTRRT